MPFPQQPPSPDVTGSPITQFFEGVGERTVDIVPELLWGLVVANMSAPASTLYRARPGELDTNGAGERAINAINEVNPLYAAGIDVVDGTNAYERGDFVGVGKATLGLGVTVLMVAITLKGARTTRGPPSTNQPVKRKFKIPDRAEGFERAKGADGVPRCEYCGRELDAGAGKPSSYEADHRIPHVKGGPSTPENLAPACRSCNRSKGAKRVDEWKP